LKAKVQSPVGNAPATAATNPFLSSSAQPIVDLFSASATSAGPKANNQVRVISRKNIILFFTKKEFGSKIFKTFVF
jgi:hypothetical protein